VLLLHTLMRTPAMGIMSSKLAPSLRRRPCSALQAANNKLQASRTPNIRITAVLLAAVTRTRIPASKQQLLLQQ
jgi:hypothetical protein